jgi:hypothetical protein
MQECLASQVDHNIHVYIDDVAFKSNRKGDLLADLAKIFSNLQKYKIKLYSQKCMFGVPSGQ